MLPEVLVILKVFPETLPEPEVWTVKVSVVEDQPEPIWAWAVVASEMSAAVASAHREWERIMRLLRKGDTGGCTRDERVWLIHSGALGAREGRDGFTDSDAEREMRPTLGVEDLVLLIVGWCRELV